MLDVESRDVTSQSYKIFQAVTHLLLHALREERLYSAKQIAGEPCVKPIYCHYTKQGIAERLVCFNAPALDNFSDQVLLENSRYCGVRLLADLLAEIKQAGSEFV